jgi:cardiolipin synthase A/B
MEHARNYIHVQYYIIRNDELWQEIEEVLVRKARQGVEVRVLFDSMGCRGMRNSDWVRLEKAGIEVAEFFPAIFGQLQLRVNYRNHRKIVVIDGRIGFVGGFNIGREYVGKDKKFGYWRDTHICIEGSAVTSLAVRFVLDWNYAAKENLFLEDRLFEIPTYIRNGRDPIQIISSGPDSRSQEIRDNYLRLIHMARKSIYIQTPYFIPDDDIADALVIAAKSGIDVRIMIPCKPDHPFVYWATYSYLGEMIEAGARCYTYDNGFLHAKCMCVDGLVSCMGTANMDIRSFSLNFEVNAVIYSARTTERLMEAFENDITKSTLVTRKKYEQRSLLIRIKEQFCRLLSPVL